MRIVSKASSAALVLTLVLGGESVKAEDKPGCKPDLMPDGRPTLEGNCRISVFDDKGVQIFMVDLQDGLAAEAPPGAIELVRGAMWAEKLPGTPRILVKQDGEQAVITSEDEVSVYRLSDTTVAVRSERGETLIETSWDQPQRVPQSGEWHYVTLGANEGECAVRWVGRPPKNGGIWLLVATALFLLASRRMGRGGHGSKPP